MRHFRFALFACLTLLCLAPAPHADAAMVVYRMEGKVTSFTGDAPFDVGDSFELRLRYDTDAPLEILLGARAEVFASAEHPIGLLATIGGLSYGGVARDPGMNPRYNELFLSEDENEDVFIATIPGARLDLIDDVTLDAFNFQPKNPDDPYGSYYIPTLYHGQFDRGVFQLAYRDWSMRGNIDVDSVSSVVAPEPSTLASGVVGLGLAGIAWLRRRR